MYRGTPKLDGRVCVQLRAHGLASLAFPFRDPLQITDALSQRSAGGPRWAAPKAKDLRVRHGPEGPSSAHDELLNTPMTRPWAKYPRAGGVYSSAPPRGQFPSRRRPGSARTQSRGRTGPESSNLSLSSPPFLPMLNATLAETEYEAVRRSACASGPGFFAARVLGSCSMR